MLRCFVLQKHRPDPEQEAAAAAAKQQKKKQKDPLGGSLALQVEQHTAQVTGIMSAATFSSLEISEQTAKGIADMEFTHMTEVQVGADGCIWRCCLQRCAISLQSGGMQVVKLVRCMLRDLRCLFNSATLQMPAPCLQRWTPGMLLHHAFIADHACIACRKETHAWCNAHPIFFSSLITHRIFFFSCCCCC
jgi:hypothetical protein